MSANYARFTTLTYAVTGAMCLTLPLVRPAESRGGVVVALLLGAPLATVAALLAWLHRALDLQGRSDWWVSLAYAGAAVLFVQPLPYWFLDDPLDLAVAILAVVVPGAAAIAVAALLVLAVRTWRRTSRSRYLLALGVLFVADPFAWSVYVALWGAAGTGDAVGLLSEFFVSWSIAALVLLAGLARLHVRRAQIGESRQSSA